jgi:hypothetical protein
MGKNETKIIKLFPALVLLFLLLQIPCAGVQAQSRKVKQAERRYKKLEEREQRDYDKKRKETLKHRYEIQTPGVQDRMKETAKRKKGNEDENKR